MAKKKFYVVWKGRKPGIYETWDECKAQTDGFPGAKFRSFPTYPMAEEAYGKTPKASKTIVKKHQETEKSEGVRHTDTFDWAIFCDGGCDPNPGPSGTGMAVYTKGKLHETWYGHHEYEGTNNRAELFGMLRSLDYVENLLKDGLVSTKNRAVICCDSQYAINCIIKWSRSWRKNGWMTKSGSPVQNREIIEAANDKFITLNNVVEIRKVKGHSGIPGNELADQLASKAQINKVFGWEQLTEEDECVYMIAMN